MSFFSFDVMRLAVDTSKTLEEDLVLADGFPGVGVGKGEVGLSWGGEATGVL